MAGQDLVADEYIEAFIEHGQLSKQKFCSNIESLGLSKEAIIESTKEFIDFKSILEKLKGEEISDEVKTFFINNGYITKQNIISIINRSSYEMQEAEILEIMGNRKIENYYFNSFISIMICLHMRQVFKSFDKDGNGYISLHELGDYLEANQGKYVSFHKKTQKMKEVDLNGDGKISYQEFLRMMIYDEDSYKDDIREAFKGYDVDCDGFITREELKEGLAKVGGNVDDDDVDGILKNADKDGDDKINFEEFIATINWNN
ncbi:unnamed protein product [Meganyctiphanes norvegica]|uniref:EF-hand domain-containing protein n=1 Tax=Meganyctiphanes norvegica TaxID=48144 RepID=A0AAV2PID0_MEGNR